MESSSAAKERRSSLSSIPFSERPYLASAESYPINQECTVRLTEVLKEYRRHCKNMDGCVSCTVLILEGEAHGVECEVVAIDHESAHYTPGEPPKVKFLTLWAEEKFQAANMKCDELLEISERAFPLCSSFPTFSFWVQLNGTELRQRLNPSRPSENFAMSENDAICSESDTVVTTRWKIHDQRALNISIRALSSLSQIALSFMPNSKPNDEAKNSEVHSPSCLQSETYLIDNADSPNELLEISVWTTREAFDEFLTNDTVKKYYQTMRKSNACQQDDPTINIWRRLI